MFTDSKNLINTFDQRLSEFKIFKKISETLLCLRWLTIF